jgi:hypothetical protein
MIYFARCSRNQLAFLRAGAGEPNSEEIRTGRTKPGNRFQGHFQGQARQLISQAFGRAILESVFKFTHDKNMRRCCVHPRWRRLLKIMPDIIYIGIVVVFFAAFALYARGCEKL